NVPAVRTNDTKSGARPERRSNILFVNNPSRDPEFVSRNLALSAALAAEYCRLGLTDVPCFLNDRRGLGIGEEAFKPLLIPIEDHPDPVGLRRIAEDSGTLGSVLFALFGAFGGEDSEEAVEVFNLCRCEHHGSSPWLDVFSDLSS